METMKKNKKNRLYHLIFITCNILLVIFTLYITRTAIDDFENVMYFQRNHYKTFAITQMSQYYYSEKYTTDSSDLGLAKFLNGTLQDNEAGILCSWEPEKGFPVLWIEGNPDFHKYAACNSFRDGIKLSDSLGITPEKENLKIYNAIINYQVTNDKKPLIVTRGDGTKFLVTWVIIPSPNPKIAKYVFIVYTPTINLDILIEGTRVKYVWLFSGATLLAGMILVLIPIALTYNKKE
jgi:hypothetical protein